MLDAVTRLAGLLTGAARWFVLAALLTLVAALVGLRLQADGIALFWPAGGVFAGVVLLTRGASRWMASAGALVGLAAANALEERSLGTVAVFLAGNLLQALLVAGALERLAGWPFRLDRIRSVLMFLAVAITAPVLVAIVGAMGLGWSGHVQGNFTHVWWLWVSSNAVGLVSITPAVLLLGHLRADSLRGQAEDVALILAVVAAAVVVIGAIVPGTSLLMLVVLVLLVPLVLWVALRADMARAAVALLIVSLVSIWTAAEGGLFDDATWAGQAFLLAAGSALLLLGAWRNATNTTDQQRIAPPGIDLRALVVLIPLAVFAVYAWWSWHAAETQSLQRAATRATVIAEQVNSALGAQNLMLSVVMNRIRGRTGPEVALDSGIPQFLSELTQTARMARGVGIVDVATGRAVATSGLWPVPELDFSSFDWFMAHRDGNAPVQFGKSIRFAETGMSGFTVSHYDRAARLIAVSFVGAELMEEAFALAREGTYDALTLIRADGAAMAMGRPDAKPVGFRAPPNSIFMRWQGGDLKLPARKRSGVDGRTRLWQIAQVARHPVYVVYGLELSSVLAHWLRHLVPFGMVSLAAAAALWLLTSCLQSSAAAAAAARALAENAEALRESEARFRSLTTMSSDWYWEQDENFRFVDFSNTMPHMDRDWHIGKTRWELPSFGVTDATWAEHRALLERHEPFRHFEYEAIDKKGRKAWVSINGDPMFDAAGLFRGYRGTGTDITEQKRAMEQIRLLMGEVNHRSKNILAVVQAISRQTVASSPEDFLQKFNDRLQSLAASQDLLIQSDWRSVPLTRLIRSQLSHFGDLIGTRIVLEGPELPLSTSAAQALGMAVHELATNAVKYGALSNEKGRVTIAWATTPDAEKGPQFTLSWVESGGPNVQKPERSGFGSTVTSKMLKISVSGEITIDYQATGLFWRLICDQRNIVEGDFVQLAADRPPGDHTNEHARTAY